jgi:acyl-CoA synthetase (AMP-forming)/AMP-acid ligase II
MIGFFRQKIEEAGNQEAIVTADGTTTYAELLESYQQSLFWLREQNVPPGKIVSFDGDYSLKTISLFLALAANQNIIVPLSKDAHVHYGEFRGIAETEYDISLSAGTPTLSITGRNANHQLYNELRKRQSAGLVLFSSGSTGKSKGIVQDLFLLMEKFQTPRKPLRMLIFLQLDHIGGVNSLLYSLANSGTIIVPEDRSPAKVCEAIEKFKADLLPTSPTFLNLILLSRVYENYDLSPLQLITYGTEAMPQSTLNRFSRLLPHVKMQQTYGLSEVGILRTTSRGSDSLWVKIGGKEFQTKIVNNQLWIRSKSAMLGYLNAPTPFDEEGFFDTGDLVEQDGEWLRILGRESEIINVGGFKVFPAEVESTLLEMDNVEDVVVFGEEHAFMGKIVAAKFKLKSPEPLKVFKASMLEFCKSRLQKYKVPGKIYLSEEATYNERFKRMRRLRKEWAQEEIIQP